LTIQRLSVILCPEKIKGIRKMNKKKSITIEKEVLNKTREKYVKYDETSAWDKTGCGSILWMVLFFWNLVAGVSVPSFSTGCAEEHNMTPIKKVEQRARDMFYPISNGWHAPLKHNGDGTSFYFRYQYDENAKGKFKPRVLWCTNMALLLVIAYWAAGVGGAKLKQKRYNKFQEKTVDIMMQIPFVGIADAKTVEKLMKSNVASEIVRNMSKDRRKYFDALVKPDECTNMKDDIIRNDAVREMVIDLMVGHLESHPEDLEKALKVCSENYIPQSILMNEYNNTLQL